MVATIQKRAGGDESANRQMNDSSRDSWQRLMQVVEKLAITPGSHVADLGAAGRGCSRRTGWSHRERKWWRSIILRFTATRHVRRP